MELDKLYKKLVNGTICNDELTELYEYFKTDNREKLVSMLAVIFADDKFIADLPATEKESEVINQVFENLCKYIHIPKESKVPIFKLKHWMLYAAILLTILSFALWRYAYQSEDKFLDSFTQISPGGNKATITLPNGKVVILDSVHNGVIFGNTITYENGNTVLETDELIANGNIDIYVPKGGTYRITLSDGTKVWLNSDTKMRYPMQFSSDTRLVRLDGEGYFEVSKDKERPFIVDSEGQQIRVLGTHFNVNTYQDEPNYVTSLLEGAVQVKNKKSQQVSLLKPGEKTLLYGNNIDVTAANVYEDVAWKEGDFVFVNENISSVLRKLGRWYDIEIVYQTKPSNLHFSGIVSKSQNVNTILEMLEATEQIKFKIEGRRLIVTD